MDRRVLWAIILMMAIAIAPTFFLKKPVSRAPVSEPAPPATMAPAPNQTPLPQVAPDSSKAGDTVEVISPLYRYDFSTRGAHLVQATIQGYPSLAAADRRTPARLIPPGDVWYTYSLVIGNDTLSLDDWSFTPSTETLRVNEPGRLTLTATRGDVRIDLTYGFRPDDYRVHVTGQVTGIGPNGATLVVGLGNGLAHTEADSAGNQYEFGIVTKTDESQLKRFASLKQGDATVLSGPFEWVAVKSKYFVAAVLAIDSASSAISGVTAVPVAGPSKPLHASVRLGLPVQAAGNFAFSTYVGPMEYQRLRAIGHDFYDTNPYGWPGFRTIIRPVAVVARWLLVWMHQHLHIAYGMVLVLFGIMIRIVLWPLNQKGMRASIKMQALQPEMKALQDQFKDDPQAMQAEVFKLYKKHNVNPFSGCWPMLLPWPILLALFFVFQNTIELRGQPFLWLPDLSLKDPLFVLPVLMGLSMFGLNKIGMAGMPPNPQTKMMLYFLPIMMTVMFLNFASGLNLYYFVQNLA
ncbi:MAG TPA: membrane protein insertase YidC, partial [Gemmatimonadales bacterium]|nr:membrane protein insertase YidC [Gemmatimonadales bacterium]